MREVNLQQETWPSFTETQVKFLERMFPARCISPLETIEGHIRYAGKVDLISQLRDHVPGSLAAVEFTEDEEEALDEQAIEIVTARIEAGQQEQQEE